MTSEGLQMQVQIQEPALHYYNLLPAKPVLMKLVTSWLEEDVPSFDVGAAVVGDSPAKAVLYCKTVAQAEDDGVVLAGIPFVEAVLKESFGCEIEWHKKEGDVIKVSAAQKRLPIAIVKGKAGNILQGERIALNVLSRCSSIATLARRVKQIANKHGWKGEIAGTRKTTPGFRLVEKYGLIVGGVSTHRYDVSQMCMLKDNHVDAMNGSIPAAVARAKKLGGFSMKVEVECRSISDAETAAKAGADVIMLDNFTPENMKQAAFHLKQNFPHTLIEVSGGIVPSTVEKFFSPHIDILSMGCLTEGVQGVDFSLKIDTSE